MRMKNTDVLNVIELTTIFLPDISGLSILVEQVVPMNSNEHWQRKPPG